MNYDVEDWVRDEGLCIIERRLAIPWEGSRKLCAAEKKDKPGRLVGLLSQLLALMDFLFS